MGWFGGRKPAPAPARRAVEAWARDVGGWSDQVLVKVNEIVCADPACPGYETVILVMAPGTRTRAVKIAKPLEAVEAADVAAALRDTAEP